MALLCEGTNIGSSTPLTESSIVGNALPLLREAADRLVVADFAPRNVERLFAFLEVAEQTGRMLLVQPKDLYLLQAIVLADTSAFPDPSTLAHLALCRPQSSPEGVGEDAA